MDGADRPADRDLGAAATRAALEGGVAQTVGSGRRARSRRRSPTTRRRPSALVAVLDPEGAWTLGESVAAARAAPGTVQGRRTTEDAEPPIPLPEGDWDVVLQTSWVEPGLPRDRRVVGRARRGGRRPAGQRRRLRRQDRPPVTGAAARLAAEAAAVRSGPGSAVRTPSGSAPSARRSPRGCGPTAPASSASPARPAWPQPSAPCCPTSTSRRSTSPDHRRRIDDPGRRLGRGGRARGRARQAPGPATVSGPRRAATATARRRRRRLDPRQRRRRTIRSTRSSCARTASAPPTRRCRGSPPSRCPSTTDGAVHDLTIRSFGILRAVDTPPIEVDVATDGGPPRPGVRCRLRRRGRRSVAAPGPPAAVAHRHRPCATDGPDGQMAP